MYFLKFSSVPCAVSISAELFFSCFDFCPSQSRFPQMSVGHTCQVKLCVLTKWGPGFVGGHLSSITDAFSLGQVSFPRGQLLNFVPGGRMVLVGGHGVSLGQHSCDSLKERG